MKKFTKLRLFIIVLGLTLSNAFAQYDLTDFATNDSTSTRVENNSGNLFYSSNFSNAVEVALHSVDLNSVTGPDTIFFPVTIDGEVYPTDGSNGSKDTLKLEIAVGYWGFNSILNTTDANFTVKNKIESYNFTGISRDERGTNEEYNEFSFVEGEVDTIKVIVTAGIFTLDRMYIRSTNASVISNAEEGLFDGDGAIVNNPVTNGELSIQLSSDITSATIALLSMEGKVIETKEITSTNNSFDVSQLKGMYFLKDISTGNFKKIIIK